jgi:hypothetical protein
MGGPPAAGQSEVVTTQRVAQAQAAEQQLEQLIGVNPQTGQLPATPYTPGILASTIREMPGGTGALGGAATNLVDKNAIAYNTAAMRWIEPVLRVASGAAIRPEEYQDYFQMFIPGPNDNRDVMLQKLQAMRQWTQVVSTATNANQALQMMARVSQGSPAVQQQIETMRVKANQAGTLDKPAQAQGAPAPAATPPAAPPAPAGGVDHARIRALLGMQ